MASKKKKCRGKIRITDVLQRLIIIFFGFFQVLSANAGSNGISVDGRTSTSVTAAGKTISVRTNTISRGYGINSFSKFNVNNSQTVNLYAPGQTMGTVNIVRGGGSIINGAVRGIKNGKVGGNVYFANPSGVVIGPNGSFRAGRVSISTPTAKFARDVIGANGKVNGGLVSSLINGTSPQSDAAIEVQGRITGSQSVRLRAGGNIDISGTISAGDRAAIMRSAVGGAKITIRSGKNVNIKNGGIVRASNGNSGGEIDIHSAADTNISAGGVVLAEGEGDGKGGVIFVFAEGSARLAQGAVVSVRADGTGKGGSINFSGKDLVELGGELKAYSTQGQGGSIFIDPAVLEVSTNIISNGADVSLQADERITVLSGIIISTRTVGGTLNPLTSQSVGDSGNLTIEAPNIEIETAASLLAFADNGFTAGAIFLDARRDDTVDDAQNALPVGTSTITLNQALLKGGDITIRAEVLKDNLVRADDSVNAYANQLTGITGGIGADIIRDSATAIGDKLQAVVEDVDLENLPGYLQARATIDVLDSQIEASGNVIVESKSTTVVDVSPENKTLSVAIFGTNTIASTLIQDTQIKAEGDIDIRAETNELIKLNATSNVVDPNASGSATPPPANLAIAASLRRSRTTVIVNGIPYNFRNLAGAKFSYEVLQAKGAIKIVADANKSVELNANAVTNGNTQGIAVVLSVEDSLTQAILGAKVAAVSGKFRLAANTNVEVFASNASVTGGSEADNPASDDSAVALSAADTDIFIGAAKDAIASAGDAVSATGSGEDATGGTRFGVAVNLLNSNQVTQARYGDETFEYTDPLTGSSRLLSTADFEATVRGQFFGRSEDVDLSDPETAVVISAVNNLNAPRATASVSLGSDPLENDTDTGSLTGKTADELDAGGERVFVAALTLANWDRKTSASTGRELSETYGYGPLIRTVVPVQIEARNLINTYISRDNVNSLWADYVNAAIFDPAVDPAATPPDPSAIDTYARGTGVLLPDGAGLELVMFDAQASGRGSELGAGISATILSGKWSAETTLGTTTNIENLASRYDQPVKTDGRFTVADAISLNSGDVVVSAGSPDVATTGGTNGFGGSLTIVDLELNTTTLLDRDTDIDTGSLNLDAKQDVFIVNRARSFGEAVEDGGISGAVAITRLKSTTEVLRLYGSRVEVLDDFNMRAVDNNNILTLAGSGIDAGGSAFDFGVALNFVDRTTIATTLGPVPSSMNYRFGLTRTSTTNFAITASTLGNILAIGSASAEADKPASSGSGGRSDDTGTVDIGDNQIGQENSDKLAQSVTGVPSGGGGTTIAISGDFAGTFSTSETVAALIDASVEYEYEGDFAVAANTSVTYGISSSVSAVAVDGIGISGSFGLVDARQSTIARLIDAGAYALENDVSNPGTTTVLAIDNSSLETLVMGRSGSSQSTWGVAISATFSRFEISAKTEIIDSIIQLGSEFGGGGDDEGECEDEVCGSQNTQGRVTSIISRAIANTTLRAVSARDVLGSETSSGQQMDGVGDLFKDAGEQSKEGGGGFKGLTITITPAKVIANSKTEIVNSTIQVDRDGTIYGVDELAAGELKIISFARTNVVIDAASDTIGVAVAITDTESLTSLRNATLEADGNGGILVRSTAKEDQKLEALSGSQSGLKIVGVLSLREIDNRVLIDADPAAPSTNSRLVGGTSGVDIEAITDRNLEFSARATDGRDEAVTIAGVLSLADSTTLNAMGGTVRSDGPVNVLARSTYSTYSAEAIATSGDLAEPGAGDENGIEKGPGNRDNGSLKGAFQDLASSAEDRVTDETNETGADENSDVSRKPSFAIALNLERHDEWVESSVGGRVLDRQGSPGYLIAGAGFTGGMSLSVAAETKVTSLNKLTKVKMGNAETTSLGAVGVLALGEWIINTRAAIGNNTTALSSGVVGVSATTSLPVQNRVPFEALDDAVARDFAADGSAAEIDSASLVPDASSLVEDTDWNIRNESESNANGLSITIDAALHRFDLTTTAEVVDGARLGTGPLSVGAVADGGVLSRRSPLEPVAAGGSGTQPAKAGAGGALQYLKLNTATVARIGNVPGGLNMSRVVLVARNLLVGGGSALSYGKVQNVAFNAALAIVDYKGSALALADDVTRYNVNSLSIDAIDDSILFASSAAGSTSEKAGFGLAASLIFADRTAKAGLSEFSADLLGTGANFTSGIFANNIDVLIINSEVAGVSLASSDAGAGAPEDEPGDPGNDNNKRKKRITLPGKVLGDRQGEYGDKLEDQEVDLDAEGGDAEDKKYGFYISADFSGTFEKDVAISALETNGIINFQSIDITAANNRKTFAGSGAAVSGAGSFGLAGSASLGFSTRQTKAVSYGANLVGVAASTPTFSLTARDNSIVRLLSAGRAGPSFDISVLGSAAIGISTASVAAVLDDTQISQASSATTRAERNGESIAIAGAVGDGVAQESAGEDPPVDPPADPPAATTGDGGDEEESDTRGVSIGVAFAGNILNENVEASSRTTEFTDGQDVAYIAKNSSLNLGVAVSAGPSNDIAIAGSAVLQKITQTTLARVGDEAGLVSTLGGVFSVFAENRSIDRARVGLEGSAENFGFGGSGIIVIETRQTDAEIVKHQIGPFPSSTAPTVRVIAENNGVADAYQQAGFGVSDGIGVELSVGVVTVDWNTVAGIYDSQISNAANVDVFAAEDATVLNRQGAMVQAENGAGTIGAITTFYNSDVEARIRNSTLENISSLVKVDAASDSRIVTKSVRNGSASTAVNAVFAYSLSNGGTRALIEDTTIGTRSLDVDARDNTFRELIANSALTANSLGISGGVALEIYNRDTIARASNSVLASSGGVFSFAAASNIRATNIVIGRARGDGSVAVAVQLSWVKDDRDVIAEIFRSDIGVTDLDVKADRSDGYLTIQATQTGGDAGVGIGAGIVLLGGATDALITRPTRFDAAGNVLVEARNATSAINLGLGASSSSSFGAVGSLSYLDMGRRPAGASAIGEGDRGAGQRQLADSARDELANEVASRTTATKATFKDARDVTTRAVIELDGISANIIGNSEVTARDQRRAYAIAGQLSLGIASDAIDAADKFIEIESVGPDGIRLKLRPIDTGELAGAAVNAYLDTGGDESEGLDEYDQSTEDDGSAGGDSSSVSVGVAIGWAKLGGLLESAIIVSNGAIYNASGTIQINSLSAARSVGVSAGAQVGADVGIGAGAAISRQNQYVLARIIGDGQVLASDVSLNAESDGRSWSIAGLFVQGNNVAVGATLSVNDVDNQSEALIDQTRVVVTGATADVALGAQDTSKSLSIALAGGGSSGAAIGLSIGFNSSRSNVLARIRNTSVLAGRDVSVAAQRDQSMAGLVLSVSIGSSAAVGASLAIADQAGNAEALIDNATVTAGDDVIVAAKSRARIVTAAVGVAGGGSVSVSGSVGISLKSDNILAEIRDSQISAQDSVLVEAQAGGSLDGTGGGDENVLGDAASATGSVAIGSSVGIGISVSVIRTVSVVAALITGSSQVTALGDLSDDGVLGISRSSTDDYRDRNFNQVYRGVAVIADNETTLRTLAVTVAGGSTAAIALQVPVLLVKDSVRASIVGNSSGRPEVNANSDVKVAAGNETDIFTFSLVGTGSLGASIGGDVEFFSIKKLTESSIENADVIAGRDVDILAVSPEKITTVSIGASVGLYIGLSGVVQVGVAESQTLARVFGSTIAAGRNLGIEAASPRDINQNALTIAGGIAGVGGAIVVLNARDTVIAEVASGSGAAAADKSALEVDGDIDILADAKLTSQSNVAGAAGGLFALSGSVLVTKYEQTVIARLGDYTTVTPARTNSVSVRANQEFTQNVIMGNISGGIAAFGGTVGITAMNNAVLAEIGRNVSLDVSGNIIVEARGSRSYEGVAIAAGGGLVAFNGAALIVTFGKPGDTEETKGSVDIVSDDLSGNPFEIDGADGAGGSLGGDDALLGGILDEAVTDRQTVGLQEMYNNAQSDSIRALVGRNSTLIAANDVRVSSIENGTVSVVAGAASGGYVAISGGVGIVRRGSLIETGIGDNAFIRARTGNVVIEGFAFENSTGGSNNQVTAVSGGGGLVSLNGSVADIRVGRRVEVNIGNNVGLTVLRDSALTISAREDSETRANTVNAGGGFVSIGGAVSYAEHTSNIGVNLSSGTQGVDLEGGDITVEAVRNGNVEAFGVSAGGGVVSGRGVSSTAKDNANAAIDLGRVRFANIDNNTIVQVRNGADVSSKGIGISVGLASVGLAFAKSDREAVAEITGSDVAIASANLEIIAIDAASESESGAASITAESVAASGGVAGIGGSDTDVVNTAVSLVDLPISSLLVLGDARIAAVNNSSLEMQSLGVTAGIVAVGANSAKAVNDTSAITRIDFTGSAGAVLGTFTATASGRDNLLSNSISGSGGLVSVQAAKSTLDTSPITRLSFTGAGLQAGTAIFEVSREVILDNAASSLNASLAGFGGSKQVNLVDNTMELSIGANIEARTIEIGAAANIEKPANGFLGFNGISGSVGLFDAPALVSETTVNNDVNIAFLPGVELVQGPVFGPGAGNGVNIYAKNVFNLADRLKIDTGGGILVPRATSLIEVDNRRSDIVLDSTTITARDNVSISNLTDADISTETYVATYGLAGRPSGSGEARYNGRSRIILTGGAKVTSERENIALQIGRDDSGPQTIYVSAETRIWNGTALPIARDPVAIAEIVQDNLLDIQTGAEVLAAQDANLYSERGNTDAYAYGYGTDVYRQVGEDIANFFGGLFGAEEVSLATITGERLDLSDSRIEINGIVKAGAFADRRIHIDENGNITLQDDGIVVSFSEDRRAFEGIEDYIALLEAQRAEYSDDAALQTRLQAEIDRLQAQIAQLGGANALADFINIGNVFAAGGNLIAGADYLFGNGVLEARGDPVIELINNSERIIEVGDLTIPFTAGGEIQVNTVNVLTNAAIDQVSDGRGPGANFTIEAVDSDQYEPEINIQNNFVQNANRPSADVLIRGQISNLKGSVNISTTDGNIYILGGRIDAKTINISSGGDFFLSSGLNELVTSLPSSPRGLYADFFAEYVDWFDNPFVDNGLNNILRPRPEFELIPSEGAIVATGNVFIYADYLNIDGLIQSGKTDWTVNIASSLDAALDATNFTSNAEVVLYSPAINDAGFNIGEAIAPETGNPHISGDATVRYDPLNDVIKIDPMLTKGGYVELVGRIISTGGGRIVAADGVGRITVNSETTRAIEFSSIDTGRNGGPVGKIRITDLNRPSGNSFETTEFTTNADGNIEKKTIFPGGVSVVNILTGDAQFNIADAYAVNFYDGKQVTTERQELITEVRRWLAQNNTVGELVGDPVVTEVDLTSAEDARIPADDVVVAGTVDLTNNPYKFDRTETVLSTVVEETDPELGNFRACLNGLVCRDVTFIRTTTETTLVIDKHRLAANYPIEIDFSGYNIGRLIVNAQSDVRFAKPVYNLSGQTNITSTSGSILTTGAGAVLNLGTTTLTAGADIGGVFTPTGIRNIPGFRAAEVSTFGLINLNPGASLFAVAKDDLRLRQVSGDLTVLGVRSLDENTVALQAAGSIILSPFVAGGTGPVIRAGDLKLRADSGSIGTLATPIRVAAAFSFESASGFDTNILQTAGNLNVIAAKSVGGDVNLVARSGSIVDLNPTQRIDRRAVAGLLEVLWDEIGLREQSGGANSNRRDTDVVDLYEQGKTTAYEEYWRIRGRKVTENSDGTSSVIFDERAEFDSNFEFRFSNSERADLIATGLGAAEIAALETEKTTRYRAANEEFGSLPYDANFAYVSDATEQRELKAGVFLKDSQLELGLRKSLILEVSDTQLVIEDPNAVGKNINLAASNSIGRSIDPVIINAGDKLDLDTKLVLWTAERDDITLEPGVRVIINQVDDFDVEATGGVVALAVNNIYLGSEVPVNVVSAAAENNVRIKSAQGVFRNPGAPTIQVVGTDVVLEGGGSSIGTANVPVAVGLNNGGALVARAKDGIFIVAPRNDLNIREIFTEGTAALATIEGSILDANNDEASDIIAGSIALLANQDVGNFTNLLEFEARDPAGNVAVVATLGSVFAVANVGDVNAFSIGAVQGDTNFVVLDGDLNLTNASANPSVFAGGNLQLLVNGSVFSAPGNGGDINVDGLVNLQANGAFGTFANPIITQISNIILSDFNGADATPLNANIANIGSIDIRQITGGAGSAINLAASGIITFNNASLLAVDTLNLAAVGAGNDIKINADIEFFGQTVNLVAAGQITFKPASGLTIRKGTANLGADSIIVLGDVTACFDCGLIGGDSGTTINLEARNGIAINNVVSAGLFTATALGGEVTFSTISGRGIELGAVSGSILGTTVSATSAIVLKADDIGSASNRLELEALSVNPLPVTVIGRTGINLQLADSSDIRFEALDTSSGGTGIDIRGLAATVRIARNGINSAGERVVILANKLFQNAGIFTSGGSLRVVVGGVTGELSMLLDGAIRTGGGSIDLVSRNGSLSQGDGGSIDAGDGRINIRGGDVELRSVTTSGSTGSTAVVVVDADGVLRGLGNGPVLNANSAGALTVVRTGRLENTGPAGFGINVDTLQITAQTGAIHLREADALKIDTIVSRDGSLIDVVAGGDVTLLGTITSAASFGRFGDVVLTSIGGDILGDGQFTVKNLYLSALEGRIGGASALKIGTGDIFRRLFVVARSGVNLEREADNITAGYILTDTGSVRLVSGGDISVDLLGAPENADTVAGGSVNIVQHGSNDPVVILPAVVGSLIEPGLYGSRTAFGPGNTGGSGNAGTVPNGPGTGTISRPIVFGRNPKPLLSLVRRPGLGSTVIMNFRLSLIPEEEKKE